MSLGGNVTVSIGEHFSVTFEVDVPLGTKVLDIIESSRLRLMEKMVNMKMTLTPNDDNYSVTFSDDNDGHFDVTDLELEGDPLVITDTDEEKRRKVEALVTSAVAKAASTADYTITTF